MSSAIHGYNYEDGEEFFAAGAARTVPSRSRAQASTPQTVSSRRTPSPLSSKTSPSKNNTSTRTYGTYSAISASNLDDEENLEASFIASQTELLPSTTHPSTDKRNRYSQPVRATEPQNMEVNIPANANNAADSPLLNKQGESSATNWLPYTLRWWYFVLLGCYILGLAVTIIVLGLKSRDNFGLGADDGAKLLLFGWRFTPTLFAVLYSQLVMMQFEDVRRTEPFSTLAQTNGAEASSSLLQRSKAWWSVLYHGVRSRDGKRSWVLVCSCLVHVLAFLAVAPLSSSILTSMEIAVSQETEFTQMKPNPESVLSLQPQGDTHFRTIGNLLQNVTTSAWISGPFVVFPSWPTARGLTPLGSIVAEDTQTWHTEATVYQIQYNCKNTTLKSYKNSTTFKSWTKDKGTELEKEQCIFAYPTSVELETSEGCKHLIDMPYPGDDYIEQKKNVLLAGGTLWTSLSKSAYFPQAPEQTAEQMKNCPSEADYIFMSTPWEKTEDSQPNCTLGLGAPKIGTNTTVRGLICNYEFYHAEVPISIIASSILTKIDFNNTLFMERRAAIPEALVNTSQLHDYGIDSNWSNYLSETVRDAGKYTYGDTNTLRPGFDGTAAILGAFYGWNMTDMVQMSEIPERAAQIQERIFGELVHVSLIQSGATVPVSKPGVVVKIQQRIVVLPEVAITVATLLIFSAVLLGLIAWLSRLRSRPLHLQQDPSTTLVTASFVHTRPHPCPSLLGLDRASQPELDLALKRSRYVMSSSGLQEEHPEKRAHNQKQLNSLIVSKQPPTCLRLWTLAALLLFLVSLTIAILLLSRFSNDDKLYRTAFVYQATVRILQSATFAPYSIIPTLLAIGVSMWWQVIDKTFRRLQPYLAMCKQPASLKHSSGLSYQSSYLAWAAVRAAMHKHWLLAVITIGSTVCQILVIAMSALFERQPGAFIHSLQVTRDIEPRQIPFLHSDTFFTKNPSREGANIPGRILAKAFTDVKSNWMYSAAIQLTLDGDEPVWSKDGWSFTPVSISKLPDIANSTRLQNIGESAEARPFSSTVNLTIQTTAMRARLICEPRSEDVMNTSSWLQTVHFKRFSNSTKGPVNNSPAFDITPIMFTNRSTSMLAHPGRFACCLNQSSGTYPQSIAMGYWSANDGNVFPHPVEQWPLNMTVKWLYGPAAPWPADIEILSKVRNGNGGDDWGFGSTQSAFMFPEAPSLQALNCRPIIEGAEASVTVDFETGTVLHYKVLGDIQPASEAWSDPFLMRNVKPRGEHAWSPESDTVDANFTTSYGILFMDALLGASDLPQIEGQPSDAAVSTAPGVNIPLSPPAVPPRRRALTQNDTYIQDATLFNTYFDDENEFVVEDTFKIRDSVQGLNLDLMSYAMYKLANQDPKALLNSTIMLQHAQTTFSTFFQHFASVNARPDAPFGAYQNIGDSSLDEELAYNFSYRFPRYYDPYVPENVYRKLNTSRVVNGTVSTRIEFLRMNNVATWLSVVSLGWLICTSIIVIAVQRSFLSFLLRDIESLADVLVLVAGSENLLKLVRENDIKALTKNPKMMTKLGWFRGKDGKIRWGVEVVGDVGLDAVEWVDGPDDVDWEALKRESKVRKKTLKQRFGWVRDIRARFGF